MKGTINIGSRREVFGDDFLIDKTLSNAKTRVCPIENSEIIAEIDNSIVSYLTVCKADDTFRIYYVGGRMEETGNPEKPTKLHLGVKVITSSDGVNWEIPKINGREDNTSIEKILDNVFVFHDNNPCCPPDEVYKAVCSGKYFDGKYGLYLLTSADGYDFKVARLITTKGAFDTRNTQEKAPISAQSSKRWLCLRICRSRGKSTCDQTDHF